MSKIITYSGKLIDIFNLSEGDIKIDDISFSLSNIARFGGQVPFYSVARHSIYVSKLLPQELKLSGLLHDASEAYIGDMISPIKNMMGGYLELEHVLMDAISRKWNLDVRHELVKDADRKALEYEKNVLFFRQEYRTEDQEKIMSEFLEIFNSLWQT